MQVAYESAQVKYDMLYLNGILRDEAKLQAYLPCLEQLVQ